MTYRGDFDPTGFDDLDPLTWPTGPYDPDDWWYLTGPLTVNGVAAGLGDRLYPIGRGRRYGELDYGDGVYGGAIPDPPWPEDPWRVSWRVRRWSTAPAWQRPPGPYDGVPFGDRGWRFLVEVYTTLPDARTYGDGAYGDGVYGDTVAPSMDWRPVTCAGFGVVVRRGGDDGSPLIPVDTLRLDALDVDSEQFPLLTVDASTVARRAVAGVGTPIRVAFIDPAGEPHPVFTGRIQSTADEHDRPPRTVIVDAYGMAASLAVTRRVQRPAEPADRRLAALLDVVGYEWGSLDPGPLPELRRIDENMTALVRDELDRAALSVSMQVRADAYGVLAVHPWPTPPTGDTLVVADTVDTVGLPARSIMFAADTDEILNVVTVESEPVQGAKGLAAMVDDPPSSSRFGPSSSTLGFPVTNLSAYQPELDALATAALDRYSRIVNRVVSVDVSSRTDPRWLPVLVDLDVGRPVSVNATKPRPTRFDAVVVGVEHRVTPTGVDATIYLSTTTRTL